MKLTGLTPNVFTKDVDRTVAFYRDVLEFAIVTTVPEAGPFVFVWLKRDDVSVFVNAIDTARHEMPDATSITTGHSGIAMFIHTEGVADVWAAVKDRARVVQPLKEQWYGMTEFSILDPDGYVLTFAERR